MAPPTKEHDNAHTKNSKKQETSDAVQSRAYLRPRRILDSDDTRGYLSGSDGMGSDLDNIRTINSPGHGWPTLGARQ